MWKKLDSFVYQLPSAESIPSRDIPYTGIVYLSLDFGIVWHPAGQKIPVAGKWVWCSPDPTFMPRYVDALWAHGFIPILYGEKVAQSLADEVIRSFSILPPTFIGIGLDFLHPLILKSWVSSQPPITFYPSATQYPPLITPLPSIGITLHSVDSLYRMGVDSKIGNEVFPEDIGINPLEIIKSIPQTMIILVGQPGSGKSMITAELKKDGWLVIDEKEANSIRRNAENPNSGIILRFMTVLASLASEHPVARGIIIDAPNPTREHRNVFISMAQKVGLPYKCGWISRPGWYYNNRRPIQAPDLVLTTFASKLVIPGDDEFGIRIV